MSLVHQPPAAVLHHTVQVATGIAELIEGFYAKLWNNWNDAAVENTLSRPLVFRGSLGQQTNGRDGWRRYRDLVRAGSADFHSLTAARMSGSTGCVSHAWRPGGSLRAEGAVYGLRPIPLYAGIW
jgi:hypothetical protein